ncbi:MAG: NADH-quinone oxidoreductase subunit C [Actinomycetota bacterium]
MSDDVATDEAEDAAEETEPELVVETRYGAVVTTSRGATVLLVERDQYLDVVRAARDDGFVLCADLTAVDYLEHPTREVGAGLEPERFELVVNLFDPAARRRIRLRIQVPGDDPTVPSIYSLFPGADAPEREVLDMFGITFDGHPDPTRILMPEDWSGHPLRKDFSQGRIPVQFKSATNVR